MKQKAGFTLIELLIVIAIISALAAMIFAVGHNIMVKAKIKDSQATILAISSAAEQYRSVYYRYPIIDTPVGISYETTYASATTGTLINGGSFSDTDFDEYNRRLRYMLEERTYIVGEKREGPFITESLPAENDRYVDSWGNSLRICPGRNHNGDTPPGPNCLDANRENRPIDIMSSGPDETLSVGLSNSETLTTFDTSSADDIVSWLMNTKYSEENYNK